MEYLAQVLGDENVKVMSPGRVLVQFYEGELMNRTMDVDAYLRDFQEYIDRYTKEKGMRLLEG